MTHSIARSGAILPAPQDFVNIVVACPGYRLDRIAITIRALWVSPMNNGAPQVHSMQMHAYTRMPPMHLLSQPVVTLLHDMIFSIYVYSASFTDTCTAQVKVHIAQWVICHPTELRFQHVTTWQAHLQCVPAPEYAHLPSIS
eukprot:354141-Chlamydomonas_euryale.AAC.12